MNATFTLKCVICGTVDKRPESECTRDLYCKECLGPVTLRGVDLRPPTKRTRREGER